MMQLISHYRAADLLLLLPEIFLTIWLCVILALDFLSETYNTSTTRPFEYRGLRHYRSHAFGL